jgi:hypothetical protein
MSILDGIRNFLELVNENWTTIIVIIGLVIAITKKSIVYFNKSDEEKIAIAKKQIQETMLKLITDAEENYDEWNQAGSIKRAQVINELFANYPILSKVANQEDLIKWIDEVIDESLITLREIVENNKQ